MRHILTVFLVIFADAAQAHPGHLADVAGHDHWVAGAAIGLAILLGLYEALKGKKTDDAQAEAESDEDAEAAPA